MSSLAKYGKLIVASVGLSALGVALASTGSIRSFAGGATNPSSVLVANSAAQPVPTASVGTTQISGGVAITNTPSVSIASMPPVSFGTGAMMMLPDARRAVTLVAPYHVGVMSQGAQGIGTELVVAGTSTVYQVPANQRFVLESLAIECVAASGEPFGMGLGAESPNGTVISYPMSRVLSFSANGSDTYVTAQQFRAYFDPGSKITIWAGRPVGAFDPGFACSGTANGYTVDL